MDSTAIVVSGLPASGKTTVGKAIAGSLGYSYLDKDDLLEHLFETKGTGDLAWRRRLSTESNALFQRRAEGSSPVVLVSHWRPRGGAEDTGTPTAWLGRTYGLIVEVFCRCLPETAANRFISRTRHPGHLDDRKDPREIAQRMRDLAGGYPLGIGQVVDIDTELETDLQTMLRQVQAVLSAR